MTTWSGHGSGSSEDRRPAGFRQANRADKLGWPGRVAVTLEVDTNSLGNLTDGYLAALWHTVQAAPAPYGDKLAVEVVRKLTFEIVRRWLGKAPAELYHHQPGSTAQDVRSKVLSYRPGGADDRDGAFHDGAYTLRGELIDRVLAGPPAGATCPYCGTDGPAKPPSGLMSSSPQMDRSLDRGAAGLAPIVHGPGAGEVWVCRDSEACRSRVYKAAEADDSLTCARCGRLPGIAAAAADLTPTTAADADVDPFLAPASGQVWVCVDTERCQRRLAAGAIRPYRFDAKMQRGVAEAGVARALSDGLGPAECETCGNDVPGDLKAPHRADPRYASKPGEVFGSWRCRDDDACRQRAAEREAAQEEGDQGAATPADPAS